MLVTRDVFFRKEQKVRITIWYDRVVIKVTPFYSQSDDFNKISEPTVLFHWRPIVEGHL